MNKKYEEKVEVTFIISPFLVAVSFEMKIIVFVIIKHIVFELRIYTHFWLNVLLGAPTPLKVNYR